MVKFQGKVILFLLLSISLASCSTLPEEQEDGLSKVYNVYEAPPTRKIFYHPVGDQKTIIVQPSTNFLAGIEPSGLLQLREELKEKPESVIDGYFKNHKREEIKALNKKIEQLTLEKDKIKSQIRSSSFSKKDGKCSNAKTKEVKLFPIFFEQMSASLHSKNVEIITSALSIYKETECSSIQLFSYTDSSGSIELNTVLAQSRADTVQEKLVEIGVPHDDITIYLKPEKNYLFNNRSVEGRQANRRVEIILRW